MTMLEIRTFRKEKDPLWSILLLYFYGRNEKDGN